MDYRSAPNEKRRLAHALSWHESLARSGRGLLLGALFALAVIPAHDAEARILKYGVEVGERSRGHFRTVPGKVETARVRPSAPAPGKTSAAKVPSKEHWFWTLHDPRSAGLAKRSLSAVLASVGKRTDRASSAALLARIRDQFGTEISAAAKKHRVSEALLMAVIAVESAGKASARSHAGAEGLMQLIPATAARFGVKDSFNPRQNIDGGAAYLSWLLARFDEDVLLTLAAYNAGEGAVAKHGGVPPFSETRSYVPKVIDALADAEQVCGARLIVLRSSCPRPDAAVELAEASSVTPEVE